jgi:hypothetical protein
VVRTGRGDAGYDGDVRVLLLFLIDIIFGYEIFIRMKNFSKPFIFALTIVCGIFLAPAQQLIASDTNTISAVKGDKLYTQFSLFYEKNVHRTTNYRKGVFVPINTEVTFVKANKNEIDVTLPDGTDLEIVNVKNFSGENINGIFHRTFGKTTVDLSKFSAKEKESIESGTVEPGMGKDAVIAALGYPPKHQTPTLKSNQWRYWHNRFNTFIVHFEGDKVTNVQE